MPGSSGRSGFGDARGQVGVPLLNSNQPVLPSHSSVLIKVVVDVVALGHVIRQIAYVRCSHAEKSPLPGENVSCKLAFLLIRKDRPVSAELNRCRFETRGWLRFFYMSDQRWFWNTKLFCCFQVSHFSFANGSDNLQHTSLDSVLKIKNLGANLHPVAINPRPVGLLPDPARRRGGRFAPPLLSPKLLRRFSKFKRCSIALSKFYLETKFH